MSWVRVLARVAAVCVAALLVAGAGWLGVRMIASAPEVFPEGAAPSEEIPAEAAQAASSILTSEAGNFSVALFTRTGTSKATRTDLEAAAADVSQSLSRAGIAGNVSATMTQDTPPAVVVRLSVDGSCAQTRMERHETGILVASSSPTVCEQS